MIDHYQNSLLIPISVYKAFIRKFTKRKRDGRYFAIERAVRFNALCKACTYDFKAFVALVDSCLFLESSVFIHDDLEYKGFFEVTFKTQNSEANSTIIQRMAERLGCNIEHVYLNDSGDSYGIRTFAFEEDNDSDDQSISLFVREANDCFETFETAVLRFYGLSEYGAELLETYKKEDLT